MECLSTAVRNEGDDVTYHQCCHVIYGSPIGSRPPGGCCTEYDLRKKKKGLSTPVVSQENVHCVRVR